MSIKIGIGRTQIFRGGGNDVSLSTFWSTLISATVENAAPTHVILTFPTARPLLGAGDFTIAGFTISSASWTGTVLTLVLSTPVLVFHGDLTITVVSISETATVTNNVADDGETVAWYDVTDVTTITKDGANKVSQWNDKLASGHDILQATANKQPVYSTDGVLFDGYGPSPDCLKAATFDLNKPTFVYIVCKQVTWTNARWIFDGNANYGGGVLQSGATPTLKAYSGAYSGEVNTIAVDTWSIIRLLSNGASSKIIANNNAAITGNFGTNDMDGFTLGCRGDSDAGANIQVREVIIRKKSDTAGDEANIYNYLLAKHAFFLT